MIYIWYNLLKKNEDILKSLSYLYLHLFIEYLL